MAATAFRTGFTPNGALELFVEVPHGGGACRSLELELDCPDAASYEPIFGRNELKTAWCCDKPGDPSKDQRCQEHAISPFVCYAANGEAVAIAQTQRQLATLLGANRGLRVLDTSGRPIEELWESATPLKPLAADIADGGAATSAAAGSQGNTDALLDLATSALADTKLEDGHAGTKRARHYSRDELINIKNGDALKAKPLNGDLPAAIDAANKEEPIERRYSRDELRRPSLDQHQPAGRLGTWRSEDIGTALGTSPPTPTSAAFAHYGTKDTTGAAVRKGPGAPGFGAQGGDEAGAGVARASDAAAAALEGVGGKGPGGNERAPSDAQKAVSEQAEGAAAATGWGAPAAAAAGRGWGAPAAPVDSAASDAGAASAQEGDSASSGGRVIPTAPVVRLSMEEAMQARARKFGSQGSNETATTASASAAPAAAPAAFHAPAALPPPEAALARADAAWGSGMGDNSAWGAASAEQPAAPAPVPVTNARDPWAAPPSLPAPPAALPQPPAAPVAPPPPAAAAAAQSGAPGWGTMVAAPQPAAPIPVQSSAGWGVAAPAAISSPQSPMPQGFGAQAPGSFTQAPGSFPQATQPAPAPLAVSSEPPLVLQLGKPKGNWQQNPCGAVFVLIGCPSRADYQPGVRYDILGCFRCGNEAGNSITCGTHKTGPLYIASQDGVVVSSVNTLAQLATALQRPKVEIADEHGDLTLKLAAANASTIMRPSPISSPIQTFPTMDMPPSPAPPAQPTYAAPNPFSPGPSAYTNAPNTFSAAPGPFAAAAPGPSFAAAPPPALAPAPQPASPGPMSATAMAIAGRGPATLRLRWAHNGRADVGLGKPAGSWTSLPCFGINIMVNATDATELGVPGHRLVVFGAQRCGNEAGARGRCKHHDALFKLAGQGGMQLGSAGSLHELAQKLGVDQAEVVATATGEPLAVYAQAMTQLSVPGATSPINTGSPSGSAVGALMPVNAAPGGGLQLRIAQPIGSWTLNACRALDVVVSSATGQIIGVRRCGNEAGKKSRCSIHYEGVFTVTTDTGGAVGKAGSNAELARLLNASQVVLVDEVTGHILSDASQWSLSNLQGLSAKVA